MPFGIASSLYKVQTAFDSGDVEFFMKSNKDASDFIKGCFNAVLQQYKQTAKMSLEFREFVENVDEENRFDWPNNAHFGSALKDLVNQYCDNVTTNLNTHKKKRLREYLKMVVHLNQDQL